LFGSSVCRFVGWFVGLLVWLVGSSVSWFVSSSVCWFGSFVGLFVCWLVGWLDRWMDGPDHQYQQHPEDGNIVDSQNWRILRLDAVVCPR
jgi:membrane associated rhomboid family serine protease